MRFFIMQASGSAAMASGLAALDDEAGGSAAMASGLADEDDRLHNLSMDVMRKVTLQSMRTSCEKEHFMPN